MSSEHDEPDPIQTNPAAHKAIGVAALVGILAALGWWLKGSPYSSAMTREPGAMKCEVDAEGRMICPDAAQSQPTRAMECPEMAPGKAGTKTMKCPYGKEASGGTGTKQE